MNPEIRDAFWHALASSPIMMVRLAAEGSRAHPMTAQLDREANGCIWFFMNRSNTLAVGGPAKADLSASDHKLFAATDGMLVEETDRAVFEKLYNNDVAAWFKDGKDSPDLLMMRFDISDAEIWNIDMTIAGLFHRMTGSQIQASEVGNHEKGPIT